jgi:hypothetical protein
MNILHSPIKSGKSWQSNSCNSRPRYTAKLLLLFFKLIISEIVIEAILLALDITYNAEHKDTA